MKESVIKILFCIIWMDALSVFHVCMHASIHEKWLLASTEHMNTCLLHASTHQGDEVWLKNMKHLPTNFACGSTHA